VAASRSAPGHLGHRVRSLDDARRWRRSRVTAAPQRWWLFTFLQHPPCAGAPPSGV